MRAVKRRILYCALSCAPAVLLLSAPPAFADGGFGDPKMAMVTSYATGQDKAAASETVTLQWDGAGIALNASSGGEAVAGHGIGSSVGNWTSSSTETGNGNSKTIQSSASYATGFSKGENSIAKSLSTSETTILVNGQPYAVAKEIAIAVARHTSDGSSAAVGVEASSTGGGAATVQVTASKPTSH
jgi:hypothetical protein